MVREGQTSTPIVACSTDRAKKSPLDEGQIPMHNGGALRIRQAAAAGIIVLLALQLSALGSALAQHTPTEQELNERLTGVQADPIRGYQQRSVEHSQSWTRDTLAWFRGLLSRIHLTPARVALGLGVIGTLYTAGKNKRLVKWAVMAVISWLLAIVGICAMIFNWPYMT